MTTPRPTRSLLVTSLVAAVTVTTMLGGCASTETPSPEPTVSGSTVDRQAVLDQLGPFPADRDWSAVERDLVMSEADDSYWGRVVAMHPDAVRPEVAREAEVAVDRAEETMASCLADEGIDLGGLAVSEYTPITEFEAVTWYTCKARHPAVPRPPISDDQLGYLYDYLTLFVAPCLTERGSAQELPPTRTFFVENWPNQNWFPRSTRENGSPESMADYEACQSSVGGY